jgi:PLP dependent protein
MFGENRMQEALRKMEQLTGAEWPMIGHLQTNKVCHAPRFALIQSVDSLRLAEILASPSSSIPVLLEVNISGESSKHGPRASGGTAYQIAQLLSLRGLMGMGL